MYVSSGYTFFDSIIGKENTSFYNGKSHINEFTSQKNNHRYFMSHDFLDGFVIYDNQPFFNLKLKYDLLNDCIIASLPDDKEFFKLQLVKQKTDEFTIGGHKFVSFYSNSQLKTLGYNGFLEEVFSSNNLNFYIKHHKGAKKRIDGNAVNYIFKNKSVYLLYYNNEFFIIKSVKNLIKIMPEKSKDIKEFQKSYKKTFNGDNDLFITKLIEYIDGGLANHRTK